jgi:hypothetical protein
MKKSFLLAAILLFFTVTNSFSQYGQSKGRVNTDFGSAFWVGWNTDIVTSSCGAHTDAYTGVIPANLGGVANTPFYCLDLCTGISTGDSIVDSASTIPEAIYITNNYYPAKPSVLPNVKSEATAVQLAIWHFRNAVVIATVNVDGTTDDALIRARAQTIVDETIANSGTAVIDPTIEIKPGIEFDEFYIKTLDTAGNPVAVSNIALTISGGGTLSVPTVNTTLPLGESPNVIVTGASEGSIITATANVEIPGGVTYCGLNAIKQLLVLGKTTTGLRTATTTWGALPVELSSFAASVTYRDVTLNWSTATEINNSTFQIERKSFSSEDWSVIGNVAGNGTSSIAHEYSFNDRNLVSGIYTYRLKQIDFNGNFEYHNLNGEVMIGTPTEFKLSQNYPNPFNPSTTINFDMPKEGFVSLKVFNTSGKEVASLVNETRSAGYHSVNFNASALSSGVYYYRLESNGITKTMKMALIK